MGEVIGEVMGEVMGRFPQPSMPPRETENSWTAPVQCLSTVTGRFSRKKVPLRSLSAPPPLRPIHHTTQIPDERGGLSWGLGSCLEPPIAPIAAGGDPRAWVPPTASLSTSRASCSLGQPCDLLRIYFSCCTAGQRKIARPLHRPPPVTPVQSRAPGF